MAIACASLNEDGHIRRRLDVVFTPLKRIYDGMLYRNSFTTIFCVHIKSNSGKVNNNLCTNDTDVVFKMDEVSRGMFYASQPGKKRVLSIVEAGNGREHRDF